MDTSDHSRTIDEKKLKKENGNYIVGIGASAGGLEALQKLLSVLPSDTGFPYIIVQHLSPDYKSLLSEILAKYTEMPVIQVEDGITVQPNCVYVIQPGKNMRISNGKLLLSTQNEHELNLPIDLFFRSLAEEAGARAIAIVLSGTGSDGSNGIKDIKENDGFILVQDLESAKFDGMPKSAMRTGIVDAQASLENIARELTHISKSTNIVTDIYKTEQQIDENLLKKVYIILKKICNINFTHYKQTTILRRIERRMMLTHKEKLSDYVSLLYESVDEVKILSKEILIGVTSFFRDPDIFQCLKDRAIHDILINSTADCAIRVWIAGCSTGEEAYSIAILFCEAMETLKIKRSVKIFATDLDAEAILTAGKGVYGDSIIESVSAARLSKYFTRQNNNTYAVNRDLRKMIVFSPHNVFQDPPFGRLDLISCRNMLIYFQPVLQNDLFSIFHSALKGGGYLFLGKSEAIGAFTAAFPVVDSAAKIFTHRSDVKIAGTKTVPFLQTTYLDGDLSNYSDEQHIKHHVPPEILKPEEENINTSLLEQFMPACIVVNAKNEIIHTYGESSNYIHFSLGKFSNILFDIITDALKVPVSTILKESRERKEKVQYKNICIMGEREKSQINLTAMPIGRTSQENIFAIIFSDINQRGEIENAVPYEIDHISSQRITDLEQELGETQGKLDTSIAEQECVNEELQAANEELLTANEELQSSNEELQSVNEELYTVNSEYQQKLTELADLNDDMTNFLSSTLIGIIFVDNKLNIRRYTDYVTTEFSIMDHDIGRSLQFISYHFPTVDISVICDNVLKTLVPDEREVTTSKKKVFLMRVAPYRSTENKILGCVITLVDITTQKQGLMKLQNTEERLSILQQANRAKSGYLSQILKEMKDPLEMISELAESVRYSEDRDELNKNVDKIVTTINYMMSNVADISETEQNERMAIDQLSEPFRLRSVIKNVRSIMEKRAKNKGLVFDISINKGFDPVYIGNKVALQQILINFLTNSVKYTEKNGTILLKLSEISKDGSNALLGMIISDNGVSTSSRFISEVLNPSEGEYDRNKDKSNSTGLSLSIACNLIKSMDGSISVESESETSSIITILISLKRGTAEKEEKQCMEGSLAGCNILIAKNNKINSSIIGSVLRNEGVTYVETENAEEAIRLYRESDAYTFDCIIIDVQTPDINGINAESIIRRCGKEDSVDIPIIGISESGFLNNIDSVEGSDNLISIMKQHILNNDL